ncbi:UDP-N-acetylmuramate dehydrogenase [Maridesulfovibrio sp.]|uniref:UDP-N-acetylmuramate dehydrogenase n=1 Tax=Maridesulfovibrio sp. TaxID=2795000 RepID=UPI002A18D28A|nr:UDP-N-acetylmuramate dehydrogenase [Maridesulfovibrio sp.]
MSLELLHKPDMSALTSLGIGGKARVLARVGDENGLDELARFIEKEGPEVIAIGEGSNMLAGDGELNLALIQIRRSRRAGVTVSENIVRTPADIRLPGLLSVLIKMGLSGMEGLAGIPGSVGGAIAMNAGSYGTEISGTVKRVRLWTPGKGLFWKNASEMDWGYRHFDARTGEFTLVWEAELRLFPSSEEKVRTAVKETFSKKKATQPVTEKSAGCVFKNPEGFSAGKLLDEAGFRGRRLGGMAFSEMHANFLVNTGGGNAAQALELMDLARETVAERSGITLNPEVIILP